MSIVFRHPAHWYWCSLREGFHLRWNTLIAIIVLLYYEECRCFKECCCNSINYNTSSNTRSKIWIWDLFRQKNPLNFVSKGVQQKALLQEVNQNLSNNYGFFGLVGIKVDGSHFVSSEYKCTEKNFSTCRKEHIG